jgi:glucose-1-phosphate cytidylyltransferase
MKVVILAGGYGSRISEETSVLPKPLVEIGGKPIIWHIMKIYAAHGLTDFVVCCGYKGHLIKRYFNDFFVENSDVTIDLKNNQIEVHRSAAEPWRVTLVDTGEDTMTGGRVKRVRRHIGRETFCLTYGDGVSDVNITAAIQFHREHGKLATLTAVQPPGRFGAFTLSVADPSIGSFTEKPRGDGAWINRGYFVLEPKVLDYIAGDETVWEQGPMKNLAQESQLMAYRHTGFWHPMDTLRDKQVLQKMWESGDAPWSIWRNGRGSVLDHSSRRVQGGGQAAAASAAAELLEVNAQSGKLAT